MDISVRLKDFRGNEESKLKRHPTLVDSIYDSDKQYESLLAQFREQLRDRQELMYAQGAWSVLMIFQGMDTAGKDGAINHVMSGVNPQGVRVASFKQPSDEELGRDFMWRVYRQLPRKGMIGIFNRSHYEDLIVPRVHDDVLMKQRLPKELVGDREKFWKHRMKDVVHHEKYWARNGMCIVKFFLHLSKGEQLKRLSDRLAEKEKHWKVSESDFREREFWPKYQQAYEEVIRATSTEEAPWYVIPADDKKNARLLVSHILVETLAKLELDYPEPTSEQERFIREMKKELKA